jgi:hypothetical protein
MRTDPEPVKIIVFPNSNARLRPAHIDGPNLSLLFKPKSGVKRIGHEKSELSVGQFPDMPRQLLVALPEIGKSK